MDPYKAVLERVGLRTCIKTISGEEQEGVCDVDETGPEEEEEEEGGIIIIRRKRSYRGSLGRKTEKLDFRSFFFVCSIWRFRAF